MPGSLPSRVETSITITNPNLRRFLVSQATSQTIGAIKGQPKLQSSNNAATDKAIQEGVSGGKQSTTKQSGFVKNADGVWVPK